MLSVQITRQAWLRKRKIQPASGDGQISAPGNWAFPPLNQSNAGSSILAKAEEKQEVSEDAQSLIDLSSGLLI